VSHGNRLALLRLVRNRSRHVDALAASVSHVIGLLGLLGLLGTFSTGVLAVEPLAPARWLGRPPSSDFELADWAQICAYFDHLAANSARVRVDDVGRTTEGRAFRLVVISSEENLTRLDELREYARRIADPRGLSPEDREEALANGRVFLFVSCNMHSTEIASPEMSLELAHRLATSEEEPWRSARREVVVLLAPSLNPDGMERVVEWYRRIRGTPYESASLPELYQRYAGHDNNRDWFMLSLEETRITTRLLYDVWRPQVLWDVHQQGSTRERLFVPPFRDPLNPNLDAAVMTGIGSLGSRILLDLTRRGLTGVSTGVTYDMWWNGGNRNVPVRHNMIGILTEAASANLASPVYLPRSELAAPQGIETGYAPSNRFPAPWPGGWWRVGDIARYELEVAQSLLGSLARERRFWLEGALAAAERATARGSSEPPFAWLITTDNADRGALRRLFDILLASGVEIDVATQPFVADEREYSAGTLSIRRAQPYGSYVKDLFEVQRYPDGLPPYDVTGWTLSLLLGVRRVEVIAAFDCERERVRSTSEALARLPPPIARPYHLPHLDGADSNSLRGVVALLAAGVEVYFDGEGTGRPGAWALRPDAATIARARGVLEPLGVDLVAAEATPGADAPSDAPLERPHFRRLARLPRVGVYAPWAASMDEGWTRWMLEHFALPYRRVRNELVRAGDLRSILDVLVIPSVPAKTLREGRSDGTVFPEYAGGLDPEGSVAIEEFVRQGGTLIVLDAACDWALELFDLDLEDVTRRASGDADGFACPGSILRTVPREGQYWTAGLPPSQPVFFADSRAFLPKATEGSAAAKRRDASKDAPGAASKDAPSAASKDAPSAASKDALRRERASVDVLLEYPSSRILLSGYCAKPETLAGAAAWARVAIGSGQRGAIHLVGFRPQYRSWTHTTFGLLVRAILIDGSR